MDFLDNPEYLFLDFDGVLNTGKYQTELKMAGKATSDQFGPLFDPAAVDAFKILTDRYPQMKIVIISSWRFLHTPEKLREMWQARALPGKIYTVLPTDSLTNDRAEEIADFLRTHKRPADYLIIDDEDVFTPAQSAHCIITNPFHGLTPELLLTGKGPC